MSDSTPRVPAALEKGRFFELRCGVCGSFSRLFPGEVRVESFRAFEKVHAQCLDTRQWFAARVAAIKAGE